MSIVSYFGLPMDLIERYPGSSTLKFLKMFERFIDIPRTEKERLEAWGIFDHSSDKLPVDKEANEVHIDDGHVKDDKEKSNTKLHTPIPTPISTTVPDVKRPHSYHESVDEANSSDSPDHRPTSLGSSVIAQNQAQTVKKSRLSALYNIRSTSKPLSSTNISKGFHAIPDMPCPPSPKSPRSPRQSKPIPAEKRPDIPRRSSFNEPRKSESLENKNNALSTTRYLCLIGWSILFV